MQKPQGYEQAQVQGDYERPELGGHHIIIKQVNTMTSSTGKPMVVVLFDFAANDKQAGLFMRQFKADTRPDKKWPRRGTQYIVVTGNDGNTTRQYKTFCTCFEKSNNTTVNWMEDDIQWCAQFKNKKIGGVFGIVHGLWQRDTGLQETVNNELRWFATDDKVDQANIPAERFLSQEDQDKLNASRTNAQTAAQSVDGFMNVPGGIDEELPF